MNILFICSECVPFAKVGGLADVVAGLSKTLHRQGHRVSVVMPLYRAIDRQRHKLVFDGSACVHLGQGAEHWIGVWRSSLDGEVPVLLIDHQESFDRPGIYDAGGEGYADNGYRFALLSKAALQLAKDRQLGLDVVHLHDWPTALAAMFLKTWDRILSPLSGVASVLTIHNIGYQGVFDGELFGYLGVGDQWLTPRVIEDHGRLNLLKAGIFFADALTTVSPTHAKELVDPVGGQGLAPYLTDRGDDFVGILNGVDYEHWDPSTDRLLPANFSIDDLTGKWRCKAALQARFGLEQRADVPLFGVVSRFAPQKGLELLRGTIERALAQLSMQFVVLGQGSLALEGFFGELTARWPGRVGSFFGYDEALSHLIEAGSDFFVMPSIYEPCGLNQIYSLKYGTLPIVRATGGLADTVRNYDEASGDGTGFVFEAATPAALFDTIGWAVSTYFDRPQHLAALRRAAMSEDFGWQASATAYLALYQRAIANRQRWS
ncbi:MAG: glycogen synthase GlgA [Deltaproteobacteria bacterium]|nr:glycogen synthase GlgA [Deltaproteobacteria bacterium]